MTIPKPREMLAGCLWLPRILAKARGWQRGELPPEYAERFCHPGGVDGQFLKFFQLTRAEILAWAAMDNAGAGAAFTARFSPAQIAEWNHVAVNLGRPGFPLAERLPVALATSYQHVDPTGVETVFQVLERDEGAG